MLRAEVEDLGGCAVGTSVIRVPAVLTALRFVARTTKESWAGAWRIIDEDTNETILEGGA